MYLCGYRDWYYELATIDNYLGDWLAAVLERPSSQMSYLDHFLKETGGNSGSTTHTNSANLVRERFVDEIY